MYNSLSKINQNLEDLVDRIAEVNECLDRINANYEAYALARDAAQEEIENMAKQLSESLPEGIPSPWKYNMAKET
jgi:predicted  nucleic acid-binding Zn-ribbon protein